jgi:uncharacterized protein (DUF1330 family)
MKPSLKTTVIVTASIMFGAGAVQLLHAATEPYAITVSEIKVTDMDGYKEWLPGVQKTIAEAGGKYIGGGFNKTTPMIGEPPPNRVVLIQYPSMAAAKKWFDEHGAPELKKAEEKKLGTFRVYGVEGIEQK